MGTGNSTGVPLPSVIYTVSSANALDGCIIELTSSPGIECRGFPPSRVGFPASLEVASEAPRCLFGLTPPPQAFAFRKPCGSFSVSEIIWYLVLIPGQEERECTVVKHATVFTHGNALPWNLQAVFRCQSTRSSVPQLEHAPLGTCSRVPPARRRSHFSLPVHECRGIQKWRP